MSGSKISWSELEPHVRVVILAGGVGSRFWPVSTPTRPKQLLALAGSRPLIQDTLERARGLVPEERVRILTGEGLREAMNRILDEDTPASVFLVEPRPRGTGPALTWAAWEMAREDPEAILVSLHADHVIEPVERLHAVLRDAAVLAGREDVLVTLGVEPDHPATGYGYIRTGEPLASPGEAGAARVDAFVEKPDRDRAAEYVREGYLWNSGIFAWKAATFLEEVRRHAPEIARALPRLEEGNVEGFFREVEDITVDVAVLERSGRVATVRAPFRWDDLGSWAALRRTLPADAAGNVVVGEGYAVESEGNTVFSEDGPVVLFGVDELVVVRTSGVTLVTRRDRAPDLKALLDRLPDELRNPEV